MIGRLRVVGVLSLLALLTRLSTVHATSSLQLEQLVTEHQTQPLAIDSASPRFGWTVADAPRGTRPEGYRIEVARSPEALAADRPDVWDSGRVASRASFDIDYAGPPLAPSSRYCWKVIAQTSAGEASATSWFETGPSPQEWSQAAWIGKPPGGSLAAPRQFGRAVAAACFCGEAGIGVSPSICRGGRICGCIDQWTPRQ